MNDDEENSRTTGIINRCLKRDVKRKKNNNRQMSMCHCSETDVFNLETRERQTGTRIVGRLTISRRAGI